MCVFLYDFSIIIPHRNSLQFLPKLFSTLPDSSKIEILLIDNSDKPIKQADVLTDKQFKLLFSPPNRGAGGARNVGIEHSNGKWLLFVDADDYFTEDAFETFYSKFNSDAEVVYFCIEGKYSDTSEYSDRGESQTSHVRDYLKGIKSELDIRLGYPTPYSKMISSDFVKRYNLRYDEVVASNDVYFSLLSGYYAKKIEAVDKVTYIVTVSRGSLTKRRDFEVIKSRFVVSLRRNKFLKQNNLKKHQSSIMYYLYFSTKFGLNKTLEFLVLLYNYKQNPFVGATRWFKTYFSNKRNEKRDKKYITYD